MKIIKNVSSLIAGLTMAVFMTTPFASQGDHPTAESNLLEQAETAGRGGCLVYRYGICWDF